MILFCLEKFLLIKCFSSESGNFEECEILKYEFIITDSEESKTYVIYLHIKLTGVHIIKVNTIDNMKTLINPIIVLSVKTSLKIPFFLKNCINTYQFPSQLIITLIYIHAFFINYKS